MALTLSPLAENHLLLLNKHFPNLTLGESSSGGKAVHIDSDTDIVVVAHTKFYLLVSGCHLLYPVHRLDTEYIVVTECATYHCFILVVAAGSDAAVSVRLRLSSPGGVATNSENENLKVEFDRHLYSHGDVISQALAVGEFMQILAEMVDLSGSRVVSDNPVAVISGGDYTADMRGSNSDAVPKGMVMDQVPPLGELGTRYSLVSLPESPVDNLVKVVFTQSDTSRLEPKLSFQTNTLKQEGTKTEHYEYLSLAAGSATMLIYDERVLVMLLFPRDHTMAGVIVTPERGWGTDYYMVMPPAGTTLVLVAMSSETNSESECEKLSFKGGTRNISVDWSQSEDQKFYFSHLELEIYSIFKNISSACRFNGYLFYQGDVCACALGWYTPKEDSYESAVDDEHDVYLTLEKVTSSYTQLPDTILPETSTSTPNIGKQQNVKPSNISDSSTAAFQDGEFYSTPEGMTTPSNTITSDDISEGALKTSLSWLIPKKDAFESVVDGENNVYLTTDKITSTYTKLLDMILPEILIHAPKLLTLQNVKPSNITNSSTTRLQYDQFYSTPERMTTLSNTITPDSILEQNFTTSQNDFMNLNTSFLCPCQCQVKRGWHQISRSRSELEEALEKQLKMKQSTLSYWRRRHTSATNIHQTARCIGATLTVAVFSVTAAFLILIDLSTLFIRGRPVVPRAQRSVASKVHGKENNVFVSAIA